METWPTAGVPDHPGAWLTTTRAAEGTRKQAERALRRERAAACACAWAVPERS